MGSVTEDTCAGVIRLRPDPQGRGDVAPKCRLARKPKCQGQRRGHSTPSARSASSRGLTACLEPRTEGLASHAVPCGAGTGSRELADQNSEHRFIIRGACNITIQDSKLKNEIISPSF